MAFSDSFFTNEGRRVQEKPQNPIAAKQALYNKDKRTEKVSLAQGMVFNDRDRLRVYDPVKNAWYDSADEAIAGGSPIDRCELFKNKEGKIYHAPSVFVAEVRALRRFREEQFGEDLGRNPAAYGTPTLPELVEAMRFDGEDIYGEGRYDEAKTVSFQTLGMASGYRHLLLPLLDSVRRSIGLPPIENVVIGSNAYGAYPATFEAKKIHRYRYMDDHGDFDFRSFEKAAAQFDPRNAIFVFDMSSGNNFVGVRRTRDDNEKIAEVLIARRFYSEHDIAYPCFDPECQPEYEIHRILAREGMPHGVQSSRGKKDKYASRVAFHHLFLGTGDQRAEILSHLITENRNRFLALPKNWDYLLDIARDPVLRAAHRHDERIFVRIVRDGRMSLAGRLGWDWMAGRSGMFDKVDISHEGIEQMAEQFAVYAVPDRDQNWLGPDDKPAEVTRIKHGIPAFAIPRVAEALLWAAERYPTRAVRPNPDIISAER